MDNRSAQDPGLALHAALCAALLSGGLACNRDYTVPPARPDLAVTPAFARVAPAGQVAFTVTGAVLPLEAAPDARALALGAVATIDTGTPPVVHYLAGTAGDSSETLTVKDGLGRSLVVTVSIGPAVQLVPAEATVPSHGALTFRAQNGQPAYTYATAPCAADGGTADAGAGDAGTGDAGPSDAGASYRYQAPAGYTQAEQTVAGGLPKTELVRALDANGQCVQAQVTVGPALEILATGAGVKGLLAHPGQTAELTGRGGQPPYLWSVLPPDGALVTALPGKLCVPQGCVSTASGRLEVSPGMGEGEVLVVALRDSLPASPAATLVVHALSGPRLPSAVPSPPPGFQIDLPVSAGVPPYVFSYAQPASAGADGLSPQGNGSHGSLSVQGHYTAGPNPSSLDVVRVTDSLGASSTLSIGVGVDTIAQRREPLVQDLVFQRFPFLSGQLYLPGLHLAYGEGGLVKALPFPLQRVLDFGDFNGDGLPDALLLLTDTPPKCDERAQGRVLAYTGTINGDVAYYGGGVVAEAAAVIPQQGREPEVVLLNTVLDNGADCTLASIPLSGLAAGRSPTPNDCFQPSGSDPCTADFTWRNARALLRLDNIANPGQPKRAAVATVGIDGVWVWSTNRDSSGLLEFSCQEMHQGPAIPSCTGGCTLRLDAPLATDLNGDGRTDVAWMVNVADPSTEIVAAMLTGVAVTSTSMPKEWSVSTQDSGLFSAPAPGVRCGQLLQGPSLGARSQVVYGDGLFNSFLAFRPPSPDEDPGAETWRPGGDIGSDLFSSQLVGSGDIDGDGIFDLAARTDGQPTAIHYGAGSPDVRAIFDAEAHRFYVGPLAPPLTMLSVDLDRDGHQDLVIHSAGGELFLLGRPGGLSFLQEAAIPGLLPIGVGDFDGDGLPDLVSLIRGEVSVSSFVCDTSAGLTGPCPSGHPSLPVGTGVFTATRGCSNVLRDLTPVTLTQQGASSTTPSGAFAGGELLGVEYQSDTGCPDTQTGIAAFVRDPQDPASLLRHQAADLSKFPPLRLLSFSDLTGDGIPDALFFLDDGVDTLLGLARGSGHGQSFLLDPPDFSEAGKLARLDGTNWAILPDPARHRVAWVAATVPHALDVHLATLDGKSKATHLDLGPLRLSGSLNHRPAVAGGPLVLADLEGDGKAWLVFLAEDEHDLFLGASAIDANGAAAAPVYTQVGAGGGSVKAMQVLDLGGANVRTGVHQPSLLLASSRGAAPPEWLQLWSYAGRGGFRPQDKKSR